MEDRIHATLSAQDRTDALAALDVVRAKLPFLVDLSPEERRNLPRFGDKSLAFVHRAAEVARQDDSYLPRRFDLDAFAQDVALYDALDGLYIAVTRLAEHLEDTRALVGAEAYSAALDVYRALKANGHGGALDDVADELGKRFARRPSTAPAA